MANNDPALEDLIDRVHDARLAGQALAITGGGTKAFYGEALRGAPFDVRCVAGICSYVPAQRVVTARCGTPLAELEQALAERGQCLPFEPPHFGAGTTVGGMVAAGLAGPARAAVGGVREHVLGATLLNGRGEVLSFGGPAMNNASGYDFSRLLAGSLGTLGVIVEVSLKVSALAPATTTLRFEFDEAEALDTLNRWADEPLPLNASAWWDGTLVVRLRGAAAEVDAAVVTLGGERLDPELAAAFWEGLRNHADEFFAGARRAIENSDAARLWRLSLPKAQPPLGLHGEQLIEWGGAQRWVCTTTTPQQLREIAAQAGGHATLFDGRDRAAGVFTALKPPALDRLQRELKHAFDPDGIFNPGRLYPGL